MVAFWIEWILYYLLLHQSGSSSNSYGTSSYKADAMSEDNPFNLVFDEPKQRVKPPRHFADLDPAQRKVLAVELGIPAFRANQVATHFFTHHNDDTESWTDIPKETRSLMAEKFTPKLITLVRSIECDGGTTRKDLWRLHDGVL